MSVDFNIKVGGEAGQGIQTIGLVLAKIFVRGGLYVFGIQYYLSRVRGGHNFFQVRISDSPVSAMTEKVNMLIALDAASIDEH
ncbi:MAG: 2-oxoacid:acceptor oxidoreductase family protein, partial [Candidatus Hydrothermarchaeales archaeon]